MGVYEEEARFLIAKYGTPTAPPGGPTWWPVSTVTMTAEAVLILIGLILLGIVLYIAIRDFFAARERERDVRDAYERSFDE